MCDKMHVFERAGLGKAPFTLVGFSEDRGPKIISQKGGVTMTVGSPGQPMGICDFCGTGIANCFHIQSADGKAFIVGSDCVNKTHDAGLRKVVNRKVAEMRTEARHRREAEKIAKLQDCLGQDDVRKALEQMPCPNGRNQSALGWVEWMMRNAGNAGKIKVARFVAKATG